MLAKMRRGFDFRHLYSNFHFQTMTSAHYDTLGVGVTIEDDVAYCIMFVGNPKGHNAYD